MPASNTRAPEQTSIVQRLLEDDAEDGWVVAIAAEHVGDDVLEAQTIVDAGIHRSARIAEAARAAIAVYDSLEDEDDTKATPLAAYLHSHPRERQLLALRRLLLDRKDRIQTYIVMSTCWIPLDLFAESEAALEDEDDPWTDPSQVIIAPEVEGPVPLSEFLTQPLVESAIALASVGQIPALKELLKHHTNLLFPFRFSILEHIPLHVNPSQYHNILPSNDVDTNIEIKPEPQPWRHPTDWVESEEFLSSLLALSPEEAAWFSEDNDTDLMPCTRPLPADELSAWYISRVHAFDRESGLMDYAVVFLQHGASLGVPGLDEIGEDLLLLEKLIYDTRQPRGEPHVEWTLSMWRGMEPFSVVKAYLQHSDPESISDDIKRLVMPYLSVLEARAERRKKPDPSLSKRLIYAYILHAPLSLLVGVFESSKPDIKPASQRIIQDDADLARLALSCLYGSYNLDGVALMNRIFECQPDWGDERDDRDETEATLNTLASFMAPSATQPNATPAELFVFFEPLTPSALSCALDILEVHLEAGEIFAKWGLQAPFRWFLQSAQDISQQRAWATRLSRRATVGGKKIEEETQWRNLLHDMHRLAATADSGVLGALALLEKREISRIFLGGLLSSGNFPVAKHMLSRMRGIPYLEGPDVEEVCLTISQEFYENAAHGNLHRGEMKLAYDCLSVAPPTSKIRQESEFIEATSHICSYINSHDDTPLTPLEIRLTKDRLSLIARVLSSSDEAYKHPDDILELTRKLGFKDNLSAEVKVLAMLVEVALQHENFAKANILCERMVIAARSLRDQSQQAEKDASSAHSLLLTADTTTTNAEHDGNQRQDAIEVAWRSCYQLGRQSEFHEIPQKLRLLGFALELCSTSATLDILNVWRRIESEEVERRKALSDARSKTVPATASNRQNMGYGISRAALLSRPTSLLGDLSPLINRPQDAAAQMLSRVTATFPFGARASTPKADMQPNASSLPRTERITADVGAGAKQALARGVGWLIGADEEESEYKGLF